MIKVTVLMGGVSSEREVSISSGKAVSKALKIAGYDIDEIVISNESFNAKIINSDVTFMLYMVVLVKMEKFKKFLKIIILFFGLIFIIMSIIF